MGGAARAAWGAKKNGAGGKPAPGGGESERDFERHHVL
jgi:hypothetical protein